MTIHARLTAAFAIMAAVMLLQSGVTIYSNKHYAEEIEELAAIQDATEQLAALAINGQKLRRYEKEYFIYVNDEARRTQYGNEWFEGHNAIRDELAALRADDTAGWTESDLRQVEEWKAALNAYQRGFTRIDVQVGDGNITDALAANVAIQDGKNAFRVFLDGVAAMVVTKEGGAQAIRKHAKETHGLIDALLSFLVIIGVLVAIGMAIYVPRSVSTPLRQLTEAANEMSKGKIRDDLSIEGPPEIRDLAESMERLRIALHGILQRLQAGAGRRTAPVSAIKPGGTGTSTRL